MSKKRKIWFGFLAFAPLVMLIPLYYSLIVMVPQPELVKGSAQPLSLFVENIFFMTFFFSLWAILLIIALIYYINDILKNPAFVGKKKKHKWFWFFITFLMTSIAMIAYFFKEIINRKTNVSV